MKKIGIVSDRYLRTLNDKVDGVMQIALSARSLKKFNNKLIDYQSSEMNGLLMVLSEKVDEDIVDLFRETCSLWKVFTNSNMVIYCENDTIYDELQRIIESEELTCRVDYLQPQKELTEGFIMENMLALFADEDIYTRKEETDNTVEIVSKRIVDDSVQKTDRVLELMNRMINTDVHKELTSPDHVDNLIKNPSEFIKDDEIVSDIDKMLEELELTKKSLEEDTQEYQDINIEIGILNVLRDTRDSKIKSSLLRGYINKIRDDLTHDNDIDIEDIQKHKNDVLYLKKKQIQLEDEIRNTIKSSQERIRTVNKLFNLGESKRKILLLKEQSNNSKYRKNITTALSIGKEGLISIKSLHGEIKNVITELNGNLMNVSKTFSSYTAVRDEIDSIRSSHIDKLLHSKKIKLVVNTDLESKIYTVCGLTNNCGASLTATGLAHVKRKSLLVDLRLDNATSEAYYTKVPQFDLETWIDKSIDEIVSEIRQCEYNVVLPNLSAVLITDRSQFFTKILTVLEKVSGMYDRIVVLLNPDKEESSVFLKYSVVNIMVAKPDPSLYISAKSRIKKLMRYDNLRVRYMVFSPTASQFDMDRAMANLGISRDLVKAVAVPFFPVDNYKIVKDNIFVEKPILVNTYDF